MIRDEDHWRSVVRDSSARRRCLTKVHEICASVGLTYLMKF